MRHLPMMLIAFLPHPHRHDGCFGWRVVELPLDCRQDRVGDLGEVRIGHAVRQGAAQKDGARDVVCGIVMMLRGENSREVVKNVEAKVREINANHMLPDDLEQVFGLHRGAHPRGGAELLDHQVRLLAGVDQDLLRKAVVAGLQNQDGHARGKISGIYQQLSYEEIKPLLPAINQAIIEPAPSGEMFADEIRVEGLRILAQHHIEEGISALVKYTRDQNPWESQIRTPELMKILLTYGTHAKVVVPELTKIANYFEKEEKDFPPHLMRMKAKSVRETITAVEASTDSPKLIRIKSDKNPRRKSQPPRKTHKEQQ
jgi:hypothetical protein